MDAKRKWTESYRAKESRDKAIVAALCSCRADRKRWAVHNEIHSDCLQINSEGKVVSIGED